uniref:FYVE-type domain-containing protein n=1 Tax=Panagrolaimus davidi TaxID=227884 RepID=A0A914QEC4_9BILA
MPCSNCMTEYSHFRKEHGCSKCAYGFCEKCVSNRIVIPGLNSKPLSVCDSCYAKMTGKEHIPGPNLNKQNDRFERGPGGTKPKNWWGDDVLPPPSMRRDYLKPKKTVSNNSRNNGSGNDGDGGGSKEEKDMLEIQARLARLKEKPINEVKNPRIAVTGKGENGDVPTGRKVLDSMKEDPHFPCTSNGNHSVTSGSSSNAPTVSEIEERLAALRGVPVEVIRKPRMLVTNDSDDEDIELPDDAKKLLEEIERSQKRKHTGYVNEGLQADDHNRESCTSLDSLAFKKIVKECEDTPSIASTISTNPFPNFAEQCKKVRQDAIEAEKQATKFLKEHGVEPENDDNEEIIPPPKNVKPLESTPKSVSRKKDPMSPKASSPKKGFFSKLFKTYSKD